MRPSQFERRKIMSEQNKALVRRLTEEVMNRGNFAVVEELVAPDYTGHSPTAETRGSDGYRQFYQGLRGAFPDIQCTIEDLVGDGDKVVSRWRAHGTHKGEYAGLPPTGKTGVVTGTSLFRINNGRVVECWTNADDLSLLQLVGAIPELGLPKEG
jgi:steroid delta-isomerase-like uncharacterized protein